MIWVLTHHNIFRSTQCVGLEIKAFASCYIDGFEIHKFKRMEGPAFPTKLMFTYASMWNAGHKSLEKWVGGYKGCNKPYICTYMDIVIPDSRVLLHELPTSMMQILCLFDYFRKNGYPF